MSKIPKRDRKLLRKGYALRRRIKAHEKFEGWQDVKVKVTGHRLRLTLVGENANGDPWQKKVELGQKSDLNIDRFVGKFQCQKVEKN
jgi:hypothetical protein